MTLDEFRATRVAVDDLSAHFPDPTLVGMPGYIYCGWWWVGKLTEADGTERHVTEVEGVPEGGGPLADTEELLHMSLVLAGEFGPHTPQSSPVAAPAVAAAGKADGVAGMEVVRAERSDSSPDPWPAHGPATVERVKREILEDIFTLRMPGDVKSFGGLNQWVDPQQYGGQLDGTGLVSPERMDFWRQVHQAVDAWLAAGRPEGGGR